MGSPLSIPIPTTRPGQRVDISVELRAPNITSRGDWRIVNHSGTAVSGGQLWAKLNVPGGPVPPPPPGGGQGGEVEVRNVQFPSVVTPGQSFRPEVTVRVNSGNLLQSRGDMLRNMDGNLYGAHPFVQVQGNVYAGQEHTFTFYADDPITAPSEPGSYQSKWRVWRNGNWVGPEITIAFQVQTEADLNHPPHAPTLGEPSEWTVLYNGAMPTLHAQHNGDPDNDPVTHYYFDIFDSHTNPKSGWITSNSWAPPGLGYYGYVWRVKVRDSRGAESAWSEIRHFSIEDPNPHIYDFHVEACRPAWTGGEPDMLCFCADSNATTLKIMVNSATDGSDDGEWQILNELGVPRHECNSDDDRPPTWRQLEAETGTHLARLYARRDGGWDAAAVQDITINLPANRRPNSPGGRAPAHNSYVDSQTVRFDWVDTLRTTQYRLQLGTSPSPASGILVDTTLPVGTSVYTHTFDTDHETVYWWVTATGPHGTNDSNSRFHIDITPPTSLVQALPTTTTDTVFSVQWGGSDARSGLNWYDVQVREGNRPTSEWVNWQVNTTHSSALFQGQPGRTYYFRVRAMDKIGNWEAWPDGDGDTHTLVDPTAAPPTDWWDTNYTSRRTLVVLNNDSDTMPAQFPVRIRFDGTTSPTAAEIYAASLSTPKGNDLRVVYNHQTELHRFVQTFTPSQIDIWFPVQAALGSGQTDNSHYHLYYGYAGAGAPPATVNEVFLPKTDTNTMLLAHFQEGSGNTVNDTSGRSHNGNFSNSGWVQGYLGNAGRFSNSEVNFGHHSDFNLAAMTLEAWVYLTAPPEFGHVFNKDQYWLRITSGPQPHIKAHGVETASCPPMVLNRWYHVAATYNGSNRARVYVNGHLCSERTDTTRLPQFNSVPFRVGNAHNWPNTYFPGYVQHVRVSNIERTSFPYAALDVPPSVAAGVETGQTADGAADLALLDVSTSADVNGGTLVQVVVQNQGDLGTRNTFDTDLYLNYAPTGTGQYTNSVQVWWNTPITAGTTITLTTVLTDIAAVGGLGTLLPAEEMTGTLHVQVDTTGVVTESDDGNNTTVQGVPICVAAADTYEGDDLPDDATPVSLDEVQTHNFDALSDEDWLRFDAVAGTTYRIQTLNLDVAADTYLYLYAADRTTLLASNDDGEETLASLISWAAQTSEPLYILVRHWNPNVAGCGTGYDVMVENGGPLAAPVDTFTATTQEGQIALMWDTTTEVDLAGFHLWRSLEAATPSERLTEEMLPAQMPGGTQGASYEWVDSDVTEGTTYYYWLEVMALDGTTDQYGPISATATTATAITLTSLIAKETTYPVQWLLVGGGLVALCWYQRRRMRRKSRN